MNLTDMTIEEMCTTTEKQLFDRKRWRKNRRADFTRW